MSIRACRARAVVLVPTILCAYAAAAGRDTPHAFGDFVLNSEPRPFISLPAGAQAGDRLWVHPLRLNDDEYLVLQRCRLPACTQTQVVRAWNSGGSMGPLPPSSPTVPIESGWTYMLWLQQVHIAGGGSFSLLQIDSPALLFQPAGSPMKFFSADLNDAQQRGPSPLIKVSHEGSTFVATFKGGSVIRMQLLHRGAKESAP